MAAVLQRLRAKYASIGDPARWVFLPMRPVLQQSIIVYPERLAAPLLCAHF